MSSKPYIFIGIVAVAVLSFYAGTYFAGRPLVGPGTSATSVDGTIVALTPTTVTVRLDSGVKQKLGITNDTQVMVFQPAVPKTLSDLAIGARVSATSLNGMAQLIQLIAITRSTASTTSATP